MQAISFGQVPSEYRVKPIRREDYKETQQNRERMMRNFENNENLRRAYMAAVETANLTDKQLLSIAKADAHKDDKYKMNTYAAALIGVPVADTLIKGVTTDAPKLSGKLGSMGKNALGWAGVFALSGIYNGVVEKITAVSPTMQKLEEKHPVIKSLLSLAGFAAVLIGGQKGLDKLAKVLPEKLPGVAKDLSKMKTKVAEYINKSKLSTDLYRPLKDKAIELATKHPRTASVALSALALSVPFMALGALFKAFTDKAEKSEQIKDTYNKLAEVRDKNRLAVKMVDMGAQTEPVARMSNSYANSANDDVIDVVANVEDEHLDIEA